MCCVRTPPRSSGYAYPSGAARPQVAAEPFAADLRAVHNAEVASAAAQLGVLAAAVILALSPTLSGLVLAWALVLLPNLAFVGVVAVPMGPWARAQLAGAAAAVRERVLPGRPRPRAAAAAGGPWLSAHGVPAAGTPLRAHGRALGHS